MEHSRLRRTKKNYLFRGSLASSGVEIRFSRQKTEDRIEELKKNNLATSLRFILIKC